MSNDKKVKHRFTIHFSQTDPSHLQVADILNRQKPYNKAQYIVNAVMHYISCGLTESAANPAPLDEKYIEAIVNRILREKDENIVSGLPARTIQLEKPLLSQPQDTYEIEFDKSIEEIDEDGVKAIANTLVLFRKK